MEYYSAFKKKEILPFVMTWVNLEDIIVNEISQMPDTERQILHDLTHMWDLR